MRLAREATRLELGFPQESNITLEYVAGPNVLPRTALEKAGIEFLGETAVGMICEGLKNSFARDVSRLI